jgi:diacylglycerol kinase (ATP)
MPRSVIRSFAYAGRGLRLGLRSHINLRIHLVVAAVVALIAVWAGVSTTEAAVLVICVTIVLAAELLNTAIETLVDLQVGEQHHVLAGQAKDLAAAAVLVTALGAAVAGGIVLGRPVVQALGAGHFDRTDGARALGIALVCALGVRVAARNGRERVGPSGRVPPGGSA